ncbi:hypothetical protein [Nocardia inohanensis]|uniref:hypothetical protein n=1 Tax=Nocardia inohanensis TaxID=209246 RepID=UPI000AA7A6F0|nr:hypothetical protein [Nocardia inohanensis]
MSTRKMAAHTGNPADGRIPVKLLAIRAKSPGAALSHGCLHENNRRTATRRSGVDS